MVEPLRRGVAEFIGTFTLIFVGAGAIMSAAGVHDPTLIGVQFSYTGPQIFDAPVTM